MRDARTILDGQFLEMRYRCLSLAADLDRVERASGGAGIAADDARLRMLREAMQILLSSGPNRAEKVLMLFSDTSPPPAR